MAITTNRLDAKRGDYSTEAVDATGTNSSTSIPVGHYPIGTFQCVWASITGTATAKLQASNDNSNWADITGTTFTTSGAGGNVMFTPNPVPGEFIRLTVTSAAGAGTIATRFIGKKSSN